MIKELNYNVYMYTPNAEGGHARYTKELMESLHKQGTDKGVHVNLITCKDLQQQYRTAEYPIYDILPPLELHKSFPTIIHRVLSRLFYYWHREKTFLRWFTSEVEKQNRTIIHFQGYTPWLAKSHFKHLRKRGLYVIFTVHNVFPHAYPPFFPKRIYDKMNYKAWHECDGLIVHTDRLKALLKNILGKNAPLIFVAPHGIWKTSLATDIKSKTIDKNAKCKTLLFFGVIRPNKGLHLLLEALKYLPDYKLTIGGASCDQNYMTMIRDQILRVGSGRINLIDRYIEHDEMSELFEGSSVMVLPYTTFASQSGVLHDALAYRLPVVVTDVGGVGETVRRMNIGEVATSGDPESLAKAVKMLFEPARYIEVLKAIDWTVHNQTWGKSAEATFYAYDEIIAKHEKVTSLS